MTNLETHIYDWVFHFNIYTERWEAAKRENYHQLFSGGNDVIRSSDINTLISIISKTNGEPAKLKQLLSNGKSTS